MNHVNLSHLTYVEPSGIDFARQQHYPN